MRKKIKINNKSVLRLGLICFLLCVVLVFSISNVATMSKFELSLDSGYRQAKASNFYFTSDLLKTGDTPVYQITDFIPGTDTISFNLYNYVDELRVSDTNINFTVTTNNNNVLGTTDTINRNGSNIVEKVVSLNVPTTAFTSGRATIRVDATSTLPYTKTLSAVFELYQYNTTITYEVYDAIDNNTLSLTVTTKNEGGVINISFPSTLYVDRTDERLSNITTLNCSFTAVAHAQYTFIFFKSNPGTAYNTSNFSVSK